VTEGEPRPLWPTVQPLTIVLRIRSGNFVNRNRVAIIMKGKISSMNRVIGNSRCPSGRHASDHVGLGYRRRNTSQIVTVDHVVILVFT